MPLCFNKKKINDYKNIIDEQKNKIEKLEKELESLKEACKHNSQFEEYFQYYLKDRKKYDSIVKELDRILTKFNY